MPSSSDRFFRLCIAYDGADFHGWQVQPGLRTVQGDIEAALHRVTGKNTRIRGAGRTDAGVHALGQVASFRHDTAIPADKLRLAIDATTGDDIAILETAEAPEGFDARFDAIAKLYRYRIHAARTGHPLRRRTHLHVRCPLDIERMAEAGTILEGRHDFAGFRAADCDRTNTTVNLEACRVIRSGNDEISIEARAPAFLKHMVRVIVGTLVEVGRGRLTPARVALALETQNRALAGPTAPAHGLVLVHVEYPEGWRRPRPPVADPEKED